MALFARRSFVRPEQNLPPTIAVRGVSDVIRDYDKNSKPPSSPTFDARVRMADFFPPSVNLISNVVIAVFSVFPKYGPVQFATH